MRVKCLPQEHNTMTWPGLEFVIMLCFLEILRILQILKHVLHYLISRLMQLLRAMFGINALSQPELIQNSLVPPCLAVSHVTLPPQVDQMQALDESLYHSCFVYPLVLVAQSLEKLKLKEEVKEKGKGTEALGYTVYFYEFST